jgi:hypothetical protein
MSMPGDITFNSGTSYFGANLTSFVNDGIIPEARVDDMGKSYTFQPAQYKMKLTNYLSLHSLPSPRFLVPHETRQCLLP